MTCSPHAPTRIAVSPTMKVAADAMKLKAQGVDVVDFGAGEPDFPTPTHIDGRGARGDRRATSPSTRPTPAPTSSSARSCERYRTDYGVEYTPTEVIVTAGGKQALFNAALALFGPGDEVITHAPGWPTLVEQIKLADATPVIVRTHAEDGFALHAETILSRDHAADARHHHQLAGQSDRRADRRRGRWRRSPTRRRARGIWIDPRPLLRAADLRPGRRTTCRGVLVATHARSHRALRLGVEGLRDDRLALRLGARRRRRSSRACNALQSHSTSNVCSITQKAAMAALTGPQDCVTEMLDEYRARRDQLCDVARRPIRGFACVKPAGAFYLFPDVSELLSPDGIRTSARVRRRRCSTRRTSRSRRARRSTRPASCGISYATSMERAARRRRPASSRFVEIAASSRARGVARAERPMTRR